MWRLETASAAGTRRMGRELAAYLKAGDVLGLVGGLGAGKTTLVQGIAAGVGVPESAYVNSPSFTIMNDYPGGPGIIHLDLYRVKSADELFEIGYEDALRSDSICLIEWFDKLPEAAPDAYLRVEITDDRPGDVESIVLTSHFGDVEIRRVQAVQTGPGESVDHTVRAGLQAEFQRVAFGQRQALDKRPRLRIEDKQLMGRAFPGQRAV